MNETMPAMLPQAGALPLPEAIETALVQGDLSKLSAEHRVMYYNRVCETMGLNPHTRPFQYIVLNGKLTLYALRTATDQLRRINGVSIGPPDTRIENELAIVTVTAKDATGREDTEIGAVCIAGLKGEGLANALMKAITKAKRRVTLSLCGLGWLDETEAESIPGAVVPDTPVHPARLPAPDRQAALAQDAPTVAAHADAQAGPVTQGAGDPIPCEGPSCQRHITAKAAAKCAELGMPPLCPECRKDWQATDVDTEGNGVDPFAPPADPEGGAQ